MGISYSLTEERIMDLASGRYINADLENYKLPRLGDIGELVVEMYQPEDQYKRTGIGERVAFIGRVIIHFFDETRWRRMLKTVR